MTSYVAAARRDGTLRQTLVAAALLAVVFRFAFGESWTYTAVVVGMATAAGLASDYADHRGTPTAARHLGLGAFLVVVAGGWLVADAGSPPPLGVVGLAAGAWLVLDGWAARRAGHPDARESPGGDAGDHFEGDGFVSEFRAFRDLGEVGRAIDRGATTPEAIAAELDRPVEDVEADLADLEAADVVERVDGGGGEEGTRGDGDGEETYRPTDRQWSAGSVASWPRRIAARLARPFRLLVVG